jgi:hypothetical protein
MSQVNVLISMMKKRWIGSAEAWDAGISSLHSRLAEFRQKHSWPYMCPKTDLMFTVYNINEKYYKLQRMTMEIPTRWGKSKIVKYRLLAVK